MMPSAFGNRFEKDWFSEIDGDGSITFSASGKSFRANSSLQVDDGAGGTENRAYLRNFLQVRGGERVTVTVVCRMIRGTSGIALDYPNRGNPKVSKILTVEDHSNWMEHSITTAVGEQILNQDDSLSVVVGSVLTNDGEIEVSRIDVEIEGGSRGSLRTHSTGIIDITKSGGVVSYAVDDDHFNSGVLSVAASGTGVLITTPPINDTEGLGRKFLPIIYTSILSSDKYGVTAYPAKFDPTTGSFLVTLSDGSGVVDLAGSGLSDGDSLSLSFEVRMV